MTVILYATQKEPQAVINFVFNYKSDVYVEAHTHSSQHKKQKQF